MQARRASPHAQVCPSLREPRASAEHGESLDALFGRAAEVGVDVIWADALNPRPRVWPSVGQLLRREFPDLHERYSRMLHHKETRAAYLEALRERVARAARRAGVEDRLAGCA